MIQLTIDDLHHFEEHEFERNDKQWFDLCHPRLLVLLDAFRSHWGKPVRISPHPLAIGREQAGSSTFDGHYYKMHGSVKAIDVMPSGMTSARGAVAITDIAENIGFGGIGLYPDWNPFPGLHLDIRLLYGPAVTWGAIKRHGKQTYVSFNEALHHFEHNIQTT